MEETNSLPKNQFAVSEWFPSLSFTRSTINQFINQHQLNLSEDERIPTVTKSAGISWKIVVFERENSKIRGWLLAFRMPCCSEFKRENCCLLLWTPLDWVRDLGQSPESLQEILQSQKEYHEINVGRIVRQPRRTFNFAVPSDGDSKDFSQYSYRYSRTDHPVEPQTPAHVFQIKRIIGEIFGENAVNMDLRNIYQHLIHSIGEHSDDEGDMQQNQKGVYCAVQGEASRTIVIRIKKKCTELMEKAEKITNSKKGRAVLSIKIPCGLYVMAGNFQDHWTHEIPKEMESFFGKLCEFGEKTFPDEFPKSDKVVQADFLKSKVGNAFQRNHYQWFGQGRNEKMAQDFFAARISDTFRKFHLQKNKPENISATNKKRKIE